MVNGRSLDLETTRRKGVDPRGRSCPLTYRYQPEALAQPAQLEVDTLYVIGGLYANLYGTHVRPLRCDALPVRFDLAGWTARFLAQWPPGGPGHRAYFGRIAVGTHESLVTSQSVEAGRASPASATPAGSATTCPTRCPQGEGIVVEGSGSQTDPAARWGDYTSMHTDPVDNRTCWYTNQYDAVTSPGTGRPASPRSGCPAAPAYQPLGSVGGERGRGSGPSPRRPPRW
jgi:hypothetical protein